MVFNNIIINDTLYGFNDGYFWSDTIDPGIGSVLLLERTIIENDSKVVALYNFNNNAYQKVDIENDTLDPLTGYWIRVSDSTTITLSMVNKWRWVTDLFYQPLIIYNNLNIYI